MSPRTRFEVTLNERFAQDFDAMATEEGVSRTELFKRAMAAYRVLKTEQDHGAKVIIKKEGNAERELVLV
jgi:metal-responsive CopG/Arc/MetJ family transcriptional regulator